tara:strand:- start:453 stop:836 length:384 start_codon:yes stop_codon:yes gene_type:complete
MGHFKKEWEANQREYDPNDNHDCDDYLADMAIAARRACYCRECGTLHSTETGAILCFITDALRQKGDLASTNDNTTPPNILLDMHYHLSKAVKGPATDFDDANKSHQRTAAQLLQQLDDLIFKRKKQ